jgi:glycosyltransferase involved in cell wall biosynthesis
VTTVSVVIPARNEARSIGALLGALSSQTRRADAIIVVDAGSTDRTAEAVRQEADRLGAPITLVECGPAFPGTARNAGIDRAATETVALVDVGVWVGSRWLEELTAPMERDEGVDVVYGACEPVVETLFQRAGAIAWLDRKDDARPSVRTRTAASLAFRKRIWRDEVRFPEDLRAAEDLLFLERLQRGRFTSARADDAIAYWEMPEGPGAVFRKFVDYSRYSLQAGLARRWQYPVLRMYVALALLVMILYVLTGSGALVACSLLLFHPARAGVNMWRKREFVAGIWQAGPLLFLAAFIILLIDLAMLRGAWRWLIEGRPRRATAAPATGVEARL